ncbi:MAG: CHASE2 domain-containing protein [Granulosicoccus sp.]
MVRETFNSIGRSRRVTLASVFVFFCLLLLLTFTLTWSEATRKVDLLLHDSWVRNDQRAVPSDIVIAAIDSDSLNELGRWPWQRDIQAQLFERLAQYGVRIVFSDILYTEISENKADDMRLGRAIGELPLSVLPILTERGSGRVSVESLPIPDIIRNAGSLGHIFLPIDEDGIVRRVFLKAGLNRAHWPSLSLAALELLGQSPDPLPGVAEHGSSVSHWMLDNEVFIPFYGAAGTFPRLSASDIIRGDIPHDYLRNRIVLVGMTATGLGDVVPTPVSALDQAVAGVEIHANIFAALRDGLMVSRAHPYLPLIVAFFLLPVMLLVYSRAPPEWGLVFVAIGFLIPILISFVLYKILHLWFAPFAASVPVLVSYLFWSRHRLQYVNAFLEQENKRSSASLPKRVVNDNEALVKFFTSAARHLPIDGWRFTVGKERFAGGKELPVILPTGMDDQWVEHRGVHVRRYPASKDLLIQMRITDNTIGKQITDYVDSLARVRAKEQSTILTGSIERLQTNVLTVSEQLEWLRNVKAFSDTMLAAAPAGFAVWNPAGECIRANKLIYQLVDGYRKRGDLLDFVACLGCNPNGGEDSRQFRDLTINRKPWQISFRDDDHELVVNFRAVGEKLSERLICVSVLDVTDIRTAEKARAEMVDYLSHDLRSPLISAMYLLENNPDPRIAQNINNSLSMMDDLLHIARADSLSESHFEPLLLNAVLDNTLDQLLPQAQAQAITFDIETVDDDLWVVGDAASLERAFTNIVGNAIKYSPQDTTITVTLANSKSRAILTVDDEGVGIDPAMLDQLFTRFKRDASSAKEHKGIGLGLALVARVVRMHGGEVRASNLSIGTRITLELALEGHSMYSGEDDIMPSNHHETDPRRLSHPEPGLDGDSARQIND